MEGNVIQDLMGKDGLTKIIHEATHLLDRSSTCTDLIFTSPDKLITKSGVHSSFLFVLIK